jgi:hypothetical protein
MKYGIPLKTIIKNRRSSLRSALGIQGEWRELPGNFPAREDEVDFLAYVKNGRRRAYLAHVEFQSDRHPDMLTRMFSYGSTSGIGSRPQATRPARASASCRPWSTSGPDRGRLN